VLGEATTNLLGARVQGRASFFDDAIRSENVSGVTLTIVPELQAGAYYLLRKSLEPIEIHPLGGRPRRGSVTVLDARNGAILANAGYPGFDSRWAQGRKVIIGDNLDRSPANERHMAGSSVKVLTVSAGYLLYGNAHNELLPFSNNMLAVEQAFQDAFGQELKAELIPPDAELTEPAKRRFAEVGGKNGVRREFVEVLERVFNVAPLVCSPCGAGTPPSCQTCFEKIVGSNFAPAYFDEHHLMNGFYPDRSQFPVLSADSMSAFRNYALGAEESRFTTMRLAAILGTAGDGRIFNPFIVESVLTGDGKTVEDGGGGVGEMPSLANGIESRRNNMITGMRDALHQVVTNGTGWFFKRQGNTVAKQFLGATPGRESDYGKSGTAAYDEGRFQDSLFVYRHGNYLIAVWLERADGNQYVEEAAEEAPHREFERHPAHGLVDRLLQLIDSLDAR
jgi:hypothetical protein